MYYLQEQNGGKHYLTHINDSRAQSPFYYICDSYYYNLAAASAAAVTHFTPLLKAAPLAL